MKKALIVATTASMIDQFNMPNIHILQQLSYNVSVACNFNNGNSTSKERVKDFIVELDRIAVAHYHIDFPRSPFKIKKLYLAYKRLDELILTGQYDLIHCHTPVGGFLTRLAGAKVRHRYNTKIIYTAHGFHFYKGAPIKNWLLYFPVEWLFSFCTDVLITINKEDYAFAKKHLHSRNTRYVPGVGIDIKKFSPSMITDEIRKKLRAELGVGPNEKLLLSVGELIPRKNHEVVIKAVKQLADSRVMYLICGQGELCEYLQKIIDDNGLQDRVKLLGYRTDVSKLCGIADLFVFPSIQEGLPVALMEAVASKIPVICSDIRGNSELIEAGALFDPMEISEIVEKMKEYLYKDKRREIEVNYKRLEECDISNIKKNMQAVYMGRTPVKEN